MRKPAWAVWPALYSALWVAPATATPPVEICEALATDRPVEQMSLQPYRSAAHSNPTTAGRRPLHKVQLKRFQARP